MRAERRIRLWWQAGVFLFFWAFATLGDFFGERMGLTAAALWGLGEATIIFLAIQWIVRRRIRRHSQVD